MASSDKSRLPQDKILVDGNYDEWSKLMEALLKANKVWRITNGDRPRAAAQDKEAWTDLADQAYGLIELNIHETQRAYITSADPDDPHSIWKALERAHKQQSTSSRFVALQRLMECRMREGESLVAYGA